ncbi:hypothetical protein K501DRAFT_166707 [Backusella circina FSU 941]|nr:hypothetical protein K501DRAFT_166707 [Backusella circina FSU 941]
MDKIPASGNLHEDNTRSIRSLNFNQTIRVPEELKKRHLKLLLMLHSSQQNTQQSPWIRYSQQLQSTVDQVRRSTTDWLFSKVLVNEHGLQRYLISFKHFFLLDYGDWAVNFIHECRQWQRRSIERSFNNSVKHNIEASKSKTTLIFRKQELNTLLVKATQGTEAEDQLDGYSLLVQESQQHDYPFSDLLLSDVNAVLTFKLEWPIDLFLNESDLENYSNIWCFLIGLKNTQIQLNRLWKTLRTTRGDKGYNEDGHQERVVWRLRGLMSFWVDTFWNHLQIHVISSHHKQLIDSTTTIKDNKKGKLEFEDIQEAHSHFLDNLISGCLLSTDCSIIIHRILKSCSAFCELMERLSEDGKWQQSKRRKMTKTAADIVNQWTNNTSEANWIDDVKKIDKDFLLLTEKFFMLASNQAPEVKSSGRLDALLMQLDHNNWYSGRK